MHPKLTATDAKNNFGGLLELVTEHGRVDVVRHGRLGAVVLAPRSVESVATRAEGWGAAHMIPARRARAARRVRAPEGFDDP